MSAILKFDFQKKKTITFFWSQLSKLKKKKKDPILHVTTTFSLKQGKTRTSSGPIPHSLKAMLGFIMTPLYICWPQNIETEKNFIVVRPLEVKFNSIQFNSIYFPSKQQTHLKTHKMEEMQLKTKAWRMLHPLYN